jgi:hypothetical protein
MREGPRCSARTEQVSRKTTQKQTARISACRQRGGGTNLVPSEDSSKLGGHETCRLPTATWNHIPDWLPFGLGLLLSLAAERPLSAIKLTASGRADKIRKIEGLENSQIDLRGMAGKPTSNRFDRLAAKHDEVIAVGDLLIRALAVETDIRRRALRRPGSKALLNQRKQFEKVVAQLLWEHKTLLADYLAILRLLTKR